MNQTFTILVNNKTYNVLCEPDRTLLDVLREDLRLTGTKRGCDIGVCGSCTVLIDGKPKKTCKIAIKTVNRGSRIVNRDQKNGKNVYSDSRFTIHDSRILTIEGLEKDGKLHPIQQAFIDCGAIQCGFCTPGMVLATKALLDENSAPSRKEIKKALAGNLCRCTGYKQIFEAVEKASKIVRS